MPLHIPKIEQWPFVVLGSFLDAYLRPGLQIAKHALGKYIIGFACLLHIGWAILLLIDKRAANATPISILFALLNNNQYVVIFILLFVAILAGCFLDMRLRRSYNIAILSLFLIPQQIVLWCSAGAGIYAASIQH